MYNIFDFVVKIMFLDYVKARVVIIIMFQRLQMSPKPEVPERLRQNKSPDPRPETVLPRVRT